MNHGLKRLVVVLAVLLFISGTASAHPHVWVAVQSTVVYGPDGSAIGVRHTWAFDDMYSTFATQGLEQKKKGEFSREELQPLAQVNVESLKEYDYFTYAKTDGKRAAFVDPVEYYLEFDPKESILTLHFMLPFKTPVKAKSLNLEVFDPSYFVDFSFVVKDPVALASAPSGCAFNIAKPQELTAEMARRLAEIPPDGQIPENTYGAAFANKIVVTCP